ncbi:MAG: Xylose isomerase domain protein barrel [Acidimicrobiales bacterium]|nr:Xylose isomerase domain protein barrel [Acidimicrobiales bacterium]
MILCSGTLGRVPFATKARAAAAAGFTGISIYAREVEPDTRALLDDLGLAVAEVDGPLAWLRGQPGEEPARVLDLAAGLGARSVTVLESTGEVPEPGLAADAFGALCDRAVPLGLGLHIEPFAWSGIATLALAHEIVARAGHTNGGILLDTWHLVRGPDAGRLDPAAIDSVVAVQVSDPGPVPGPHLRDECMTDRWLPGPVSAAIVARLGSVPVEVEVFGLPGTPAAAARAAYGALHELVGG